MNEVKRTQALARMAFLLCIGALMLGFIAVLLSWIAPEEADTGAPLLLLAPGVILLVAGVLLIVRAFRSNPNEWQQTYLSCAKVLKILALISALAIVVLVVVFIVMNSSALQLVLVALIGLQASLALLSVARYMIRAAELPVAYVYSEPLTELSADESVASESVADESPSAESSNPTL